MWNKLKNFIIISSSVIIILILTVVIIFFVTLYKEKKKSDLIKTNETYIEQQKEKNKNDQEIVNDSRDRVNDLIHNKSK